MEFTDSCGADKPSGARIGHTDDNGNSYVEELPDNFILFPNPNNGQLNVLYTLHTATAQLTVYDISGKQVFEKQLNNSTNLMELSIAHLSEGVYYYTIIGENKVVLKKDKLIIIK